MPVMASKQSSLEFFSSVDSVVIADQYPFIAPARPQFHVIEGRMALARFPRMTVDRVGEKAD